jgi:predicted NBD/HSP70 family sugar kinase
MTTTAPTSEQENQTGTPRLLRAMNERGLLEHVRLHGPLSRAQLARETGLSKPTVSLALANLERAGLVRTVGQTTSQGGGRQAILYELDPTAGYVVGVDIGRSWVRVALADLAGTIISRAKEENVANDAESLVAMATELARRTVANAGLDWSCVVHTVIGTPGVLDEPGGRVLFASNLPGWGRSGLVEMLRKAFGSSLTLDNDANLAALGEQIFGCGKQARTFVFLTVGTGIGMGIILDGALYRGAHGASGEVGYLPLGAQDVTDLSAGASQRGILEDLASADGIVRSAQHMGLQPQSARRVFDAARDGEAKALAVVEREGQRLALAIAAVIAILDPEMVILGGGIGHNLDLLRSPIERRLEEITPLHTRLVASELADEAVLLGTIATGLTIARDLVFQQRAGDGRPAK